MVPVPNVTRADVVAAARNPLAFIAARWTPDPRTVRRAALAALVMSVVIVVTGGAVRLTGSGLGCPTWPKCTDDSLTTTSAMGFHGAIEFGNRMLTYVLCAAVGWAIIAARSQKPWRRGLTRLGWAQFWIVMSNAVLGGIVVLVGLNPYTVAAHFLLSSALIAVATLMWQRSREGDAEPKPLVGKAVQQLVWFLVTASVLLIAVGTVVTGAGPHAGDSKEVDRIPIDWETVAKLHAVLAWIVVTLTFALWFVLKAVDAPKGPLDRTRDLFLILLSQGVIGYVQYFTNLPRPWSPSTCSARAWCGSACCGCCCRSASGRRSSPTCPARRWNSRSPRAREASPVRNGSPVAGHQVVDRRAQIGPGQLRPPAEPIALHGGGGRDRIVVTPPYDVRYDLHRGAERGQQVEGLALGDQAAVPAGDRRAGEGGQAHVDPAVLEPELRLVDGRPPEVPLVPYDELGQLLVRHLREQVLR